jgi:hypothetical protein
MLRIAKYPEAVWFYTQKTFPSVIVIPENKNYLVYKIKTTLLIKLLGSQFNLDIKKLLINNGRLNKEVIEEINYYSKCIENKTMSKEELYKFLNTGLQVNDNSFQSCFGELPQLEKTMDDITIIWPENFRESSKKKCLTILEEIKSILASHGLLDVFDGKIVFRKMKQAGLYYPTLHEIHLNSNMTHVDNQGLHTILHELGHKWYYEQISEQTIKKINDNFYEFLKDDKNFSVGDRLICNSKSNPDLNGLKCEIVELTDKKVKLVFENDQEFNLDRKYIDDHASIFQKIDLLDWFPTKYSKKSPQEWQAECFYFYLTNQLNKNLKKFWEQIFQNS